MNAVSFSNPVFSTFAVAASLMIASLMILKVIAMAWLTSGGN
jgi:hypothetical protein